MMVQLDQIVSDPGVQVRQRLNSNTVRRYVDTFDLLPPIDVFELDGKYLLADGQHRVKAARELRKDKVKANVHIGTLNDAYELAVGANSRSGLPLR